MRTRTLLTAVALVFAAVTPAVAQNYTVMPVPRLEFQDNSGNPCNGCKLYTYASGTTTLQDTYQTPTGTVNANPIIMNSAGRPSAGGVEVGVYLSATSYKFVLTTSADVTLWTQDTVAATHANVQVITGTGDITIALDSDNDGANKLTMTDGTDVERFRADENGDVQLDDDLTIGDATAADHDLIFDGNVQDYYACLDDSADELVIGRGATCGTTPALQLTTAGAITLTGAVTASSTVGVTGIATFTGGFTSGAVNNYINDTANANMTTGLTINQAAADNEAFALKSSDVAHGMTTQAETDTFFAVQKQTAATGGARLFGLQALGGSQRGLQLVGAIGDAAGDTTHTAAGGGIIDISAYIKSGTTIGAPGANENLLTVGGAGSTRFIVDAEGDTFQDGTAGTAYADYDDPMLALAVEHHINPQGVQDFFQQYTAYNKQTLIDAGILAPDGPGGERGFMNMSALTRLAVGSAWQLGIKAQQQQQQIDALVLENLSLAARLAALEATVAQASSGGRSLQ